MELLTSAVTDSAMITLVATSFMIIMNVARILHFAHGVSYLLGAYAGVAVYDVAGLPGSLALAIAVGGGFGYLIQRYLYRPMERRGASRWVIVMASLAIFILAENVIAMVFGANFVTTADRSLQRSPFGEPFQWLQWTQILALVVVGVWLTALAFLLARTQIGLYMRAVASNELLAAWSGVPTLSVRSTAFLLGSSVAATAGLIKFLDLAAQPTMGFNAALYGLVAYIVGGMSSVPAIVAASVLLGLGGVLIARFFGSEWTLVLVFAVLAIVMLIRPEGLALKRD